MIRNLDIHPDFGFETSTRWEIATHQRDHVLLQNGKNLNDYYHRLWGQERMILNNVSKCLGYIPLLNVIVGIARIIFNL